MKNYIETHVFKIERFSYDKRLFTVWKDAYQMKRVSDKMYFKYILLVFYYMGSDVVDNAILCNMNRKK